MLDIDTKTDIKYRASILKNVLGGLFTIGALQLLVTIFAHKSQSISLVSISFLIPILAFAYWHVTKYKKVAFIGRCLIYFSMPVLIYRAHTMGGAWGVTINWIYLAPIMSSLFLPRKEIYFVTLYCLSLVFCV